MPWLQINFNIDPQQAEIFEEALIAAGALSVTYVDQADQPILEPALGEIPLWTSTKITGLFDADINTQASSLIFLANLAQSIKTDDLPIPNWEILEDKDWQREWMANYHPIDCGQQLWVCPSWITPPEPDATNVLLDPGLAFGTGTHPTTLLCLQWLAKQNLDDCEVIDYGCGSGILAIAALMRGARNAIGIDIDPQALLATRDNAKRNNIAEHQIQIFLPDDATDPKEPTSNKLALKQIFQPAHLVIANILAGPLVELAPTLTVLTQPQGKLCLSGVLASQADKVMAAYQQDFEFDPVITFEEWAQLSATKR